MSFCMHSLLFRYLSWNQSRMKQIADVYDIQIYLHSNKMIMALSFNNFFPRIPPLPLQTHFIKIKFSNQGLDLLFPTSSEITESHRKSNSISRILTLLLFVISTKKLLEISFLTTNKSLTSDPDVRSSIQYSCSSADSPFLYPPAGHIVTGVAYLRKGSSFL